MARLVEKMLGSRQKALMFAFIALFVTLGVGCLAWAFVSRFPRYVTIRHVLAPLVESGLVDRNPDSIISEGPPMFSYRIRARFNLAHDYPKAGIERFVSENSSWMRVYDMSSWEDLDAIAPANISSRHPDWWIQSPANVDEAVSFSGYNGGWHGIVYVVDEYLYIQLSQ